MSERWKNRANNTKTTASVGLIRASFTLSDTLGGSMAVGLLSAKDKKKKKEENMHSILWLHSRLQTAAPEQSHTVWTKEPNMS